jgi:hypothetical protein
MTPSERLKSNPSDEVITHEIGHLVIGLELGLHEGGIEFIESHPSEIARAHFNRQGAKPIQIIIRGLAGMYCQALCFPESIINDLFRTQILQHGLFLEPSVLATNSPVAIVIIKNGFIGDWERILYEAASNTSNAQETLKLLHKAHCKLISISKTVHLASIALQLLEDVKKWMKTDNEDMLYAPAIFYSTTNAKSLLAKLRQPI